MANLTQKTIELFDRLYNLKSDDNLILKEIKDKIEVTESSIESTKNEIERLKSDKTDKEQTLAIFESEQESYISDFGYYSPEAFASLKAIGVEVDIANKVAEVRAKAPGHIQKSNEEIANIGNAIAEASERLSELEGELEALNNSQDEIALARTKLQGLMEQCLSQNETEREGLSIGHVKDLLKPFGVFTSDELSKLAELMMFPKSGLFEYDSEYQERLEKGLIGNTTEEKPEADLNRLISSEEEPVSIEDMEKALKTTPEEQPKEVVEEEEPIVEEDEPIEEVQEEVEEKKEEPQTEPEHEVQRLFGGIEEPNNSLEPSEEPSEAVVQSIRTYEKQADITAESKPEDETSIIDLTGLGALNAHDENTSEEPEEQPEEPEKEEDTIKTYLKSIDIDINRFYEENDKESNVEELLNELANTDKDLIANNYESLKAVNAEVAAYRYRRGHSYLNDPELSRKLTFLRGKQLSENTIKKLLEEANSGLIEPLETIEARFVAATELGTPITDGNVSLLGRDLVRLLKNIKSLQDSEINIDDKQKRGWSYYLENYEFFEDDLEILKNYLINITKNNDKYALGVFAKAPYELITDIDSIIENNLEAVLSTNPEILSDRKDGFVERAKYFESIGEPIFDSTDGGTFAPYVLDIYEAFDKLNGEYNKIPKCINEESFNEGIPSLIGRENTVSSIVELLNAYYKDRTDFSDIELSPEATEGCARLMEIFRDKFKAELATKYAYRVADELISKPKLERHLKVIVTGLYANGQSIDGIESEILLTAMLYNHRQDRQTLEKMVQACLGFNEENTLGGVDL